MQLAAEGAPGSGPEPLRLALRGWHAGRRAQLLALALLVLVVHLWLAHRHWPDRLGDRSTDHDTRPSRIEVSFVRELKPAAPAAVLRASTPAVKRLPTLPAAASASAAAAASLDLMRSDGGLAPEPLLEPTPPLPTLAELHAAPVPAVAEAVQAAQAAQAAEAASSPQAPSAFDWPPSTRLSYTLTGNYRGAVQGQAQVEWLRSGSRYQVHLDVSVGPHFAPLLSRRITSEGEITRQGLRPRRYDEETRVALREPRRLTIWLDDDAVRLPTGAQLVRPQGVQDSASQFVQMTWLFTTQPQLLQAGQSIELPLALPRRVGSWTYDVLQMETLQTAAGAVDAVHVKPRREQDPSALGSAGGELAAEFWVAPSLQYLPVRILIRQDAQTYVDLLIERLPQQAQPGR